MLEEQRVEAAAVARLGLVLALLLQRLWVVIMHFKERRRREKEKRMGRVRTRRE